MAKICQLHADLHYFLCMEPVDMRKQFHGLQGIISEKYNRYLTQDEAFIFIGKTRTTAKILHRESNGLTLYVRKLRRGNVSSSQRMTVLRFMIRSLHRSS